MRKIKERVNQNLVWLITILLQVPAYAGEKGFYLAEREGKEFRTLEHHNAKLVPPMGSLLKPFAAWYLLENGVDGSKTVFCPPEKKRTATLRCWTPGGHGAVDVREALVQSCNYYFLLRFQGVKLADYEAWLRTRFDWSEGNPMRKPENVYGFDLPEGVEATKIAAMYAKLLNAGESGNDHAATVASGLKDICRGTFQAFCQKFGKLRQYRLILGKTGTVTEGKRNFGIALIYAEHLPQNKKILLLTYEKNKMGSEAALNALEILRDFDKKAGKRTSLNR